MDGKTFLRVSVGAAGLATLAFCGMQTKEVAYGASEFTSVGGPLNGAGTLAGLMGVIYSVLPFIKRILGSLGGGKPDDIAAGGLAILQSLMAGKMDAVGLTKSAAVAIIFADAVHSGDHEYIEMVREVSKKALPPVSPVNPSPKG